MADIKLTETYEWNHIHTDGLCVVEGTSIIESCVVRRGNPYVNPETAAYVTAINMLAVEYLVKTNDEEEYGRRVQQVCELSDDALMDLFITLDLNMHISSLGAMITQGDYETQREHLFNFLDNLEDF